MDQSSSSNSPTEFGRSSIAHSQRILKTNVNSSPPGDNTSQLSQPNSDISSLSNAEIAPEKYQRLATEFAKSSIYCGKESCNRRTKQKWELQESLKQRDQTVRRLEQESESLNFRNKQLTKRISVLQTDLDSDNSGNINSSKQRSSSNLSNVSSPNQNTQIDIGLFDEINHELKNKVEENERLREVITTIEDKRADELKCLQLKQKENDAETEKRLEMLNSEIRLMSNEMSKLSAQKSELEANVKQLEHKLSDTNEIIDALKNENSQLSNRIVISEKQLMAAKQHARLVQHQSQQHLKIPVNQSDRPSSNPPASDSPIPRSGSFSGIVRSSGSFSSRPLPRSGSLSINSNQSENLANLLVSAQQSPSIAKDISSQQAANYNQTQQSSPNHSSKSYQDIALKQRIIGEFAIKISEIICALSTLHSNASKKMSILFALFNNNVNHFYFFDITNVTLIPSDKNSETISSTTNILANNDSPPTRSIYIMTILRKICDCLKSGYDTHLVHLEEATHQFLTAKIRFYQQQAGDSDPTNQSVELSLIQGEILKLSNEIIEKFSDYINYLNKLNPFISLCLNFWCKNLRQYDPANTSLVKLIQLDPGFKAKLADQNKREHLCQKQEQLVHSVTDCIRIIGQGFHYIKLLLSDQMRQIFSSKVALEHDLCITVESDLLSVDDCILSSMVFFHKTITELRLMLEMHYFLFVDNTSNGSTRPRSISPMLTQYRRQLLKLKQEKEHWTIELELSQLKLDQEQRKVSELEYRVQSLLNNQPNQATTSSKQPTISLALNQSLNRVNSNSNSLTSSSGKSLDGINAAELGSISSTASLQSPSLDCFGTVNYPAITNDENDPFNQKVSNMVNGINGVSILNQMNDTDSSQTPTVDYLQQKIVKLMNTLQMTDARAATFQQEYAAIKMRYAQLSKEKSDIEQRLAEQVDTMNMIQEEYRTSVENYEDQLRIMSEHMAQMNERLAAQTEQIDILNYNKQQKQQQTSGMASSAASSVAKNV
ncbi:hypothetical protein RDWZM_009533 [Blomia tropicalis]|uniref:Protein phosphatase 1 regulatory subunit 21 N-terminal domain-containing protein n=1 Tax=Blomia tropicalis TaxID=40697 RepID=A0A9Q0RL59_BLOTA|nr:hypothetical protein RDWZM_009533 [Blomia tropicalis]